ncbi:CidA/LrgA family protein [Pseudomonas sp. EpS/L25]|uniref:CidA/LrgA family protein n=1 Tax=Pseudomonas sp. EpS/L25 TaxID=1749078 RepID=UPI00074346E8|nr:CidA/LrgA family protein [Pseudomonas sp. EpS/L25]KUM41588.1 murein hydrolase regulator LrgA [Pseudomonas sp. EpS/L25]
MEPWVNRYLRLALELCALGALWGLGTLLANYFAWPVPGGVVGLAMLLLLLAARIVEPEWLQGGVRVLLGEMLLFFIPALLSLLDYGPLLRHEGVRILLAILLSTVLTMVATALAVDWMFRRRGRRDA